MNLNAGGVLGGFAGAGIGVAAMIALNNDGDFQPRAAKLVAIGAVLGAIAGNAIWGLAAGKPKKVDEDEEDRPRHRHRLDDHDDDDARDRPRRKRRDDD